MFSRAFSVCLTAAGCLVAVALIERELWRWRDRRSHYRAELYRERVHVEQLRNVIALAPYARRRYVYFAPVIPLQRGRDVRA
jgi:hypothetical protein